MQVVDRGDAAGRDDLGAGESEQACSQQREVRTAEQAVANDRGHDERRDAGIGSVAIASSTGRPAAPGTQPSPTARPSRTSSATATRSAPWRSTSPRTSAGSRERRRPEDDARGARVKRRGDHGAVAQSARHLDPHRGDPSPVAASAIARRRVIVRPLPGPRPVEVDDVDPGGAGRARSRRQRRDRIVARRPAPARTPPARAARPARRAGRSRAGSRRLTPRDVTTLSC